MNQKFKKARNDFLSLVVTFFLASMWMLYILVESDMYIKIWAWKFLAIAMYSVLIGDLIFTVFTTLYLMDLFRDKSDENIFRVTTNHCRLMCMSFFIPHFILMIFFLSAGLYIGFATVVVILGGLVVYFYSSEIRVNFKQALTIR